jgi:hypothetical protein
LVVSTIVPYWSLFLSHQRYYDESFPTWNCCYLVLLCGVVQLLLKTKIWTSKTIVLPKKQS